MANAEEDVLAYKAFPVQHRAKLHSTNSLKRLNGKIERRTDVVGIFSNEAATRRLVSVRRRPRTGGGSAAHPHGTDRGMGRPALPLHDARNPRDRRR
ncbi:MAG: transposase [Pseudomonadota bacterium]